jgi:hypothetical protein
MASQRCRRRLYEVGKGGWLRCLGLSLLACLRPSSDQAGAHDDPTGRAGFALAVAWGLHSAARALQSAVTLNFGRLQPDKIQSSGNYRDTA